MPSFRNSKRVNHRADEMFDLVADVECYPEFVPLCTGMKVRRRQRDFSGRETLIADMSVGYGAIHEQFASRVTLDSSRRKILVEYIDGPFSHLQNIWTFRPEGEDPTSGACRVEFFIDYAFKNRMLSHLMGAMFDNAFRKFADAFLARADVVYGKTPT